MEEKVLSPQEAKEQREWKNVLAAICRATKACEFRPHKRCVIKCRTKELKMRASQALGKIVGTERTTYLVDQIRFQVTHKNNSGELVCMTHHSGLK